MKKLFLNLDELRVESFATSFAHEKLGGTIKGFETTEDLEQTVVGLTNGSTCHGTCPLNHTCGFGNSCGGATCNYTCPESCIGVSCFQSCDGTCYVETCNNTCQRSCLGNCF
jgi:hypothetical protein